MRESIAVALLGAQRLFREGLRSLIDQTPGFSVVGEAGAASDIAGLIAKHKTDILVLGATVRDFQNQETASAGVVKDLRARNQNVRILCVGSESSAGHVVKTIQIGVDGYIGLESSSSKLIRALEALSKGGSYFDGQIVADAIRNMTKAPMATKATLDGKEKLSPRERDVLDLFMEGLNNKRIGNRLFISPKTVEVHKRNIKEKLGFDDYAQMMRRLLKCDSVAVRTEPR